MSPNSPYEKGNDNYNEFKCFKHQKLFVGLAMCSAKNVMLRGRRSSKKFHLTKGSVEQKSLRNTDVSKRYKRFF